MVLSQHLHAPNKDYKNTPNSKAKKFIQEEQILKEEIPTMRATMLLILCLFYRMLILNRTMFCIYVLKISFSMPSLWAVGVVTTTIGKPTHLFLLHYC